MAWKTVVVTGGCGFIGSNLIERLLNDNLAEKIISLDNHSSGQHRFEDGRVSYIFGNTWQILELLQNVKPEIVFHFGEFSRVVPSFENINYVWKSNSLGTQRVLEFCVRTEAKLIYSGSSAIFGNQGADSDLSPYSFLKAQNIKLIQNYQNWFGLRYATVFFYNVYGKRDIEVGEYKTAIATFRRQFINDSPLTVVSPGTQKRIWTNILDIIDGVIICAKDGNGDNYKLASDDDLSIMEVVTLFGPKARFVVVPERKGERFQSETSESRARTELGWTPKIRLADYIQDFINKRK
jgi:UDP-glucose 4-epimerase